MRMSPLGRTSAQKWAWPKDSPEDRGFAKGWFPKGWFWRMFPWNENRNEGTFAKTTLLRNRPFISQWEESVCGHFRGHPRGTFRGAFRGESSTRAETGKWTFVGTLVGTLVGALVGAFVGPLVGATRGPTRGVKFRSSRALCLSEKKRLRRKLGKCHRKPNFWVVLPHVFYYINYLFARGGGNLHKYFLIFFSVSGRRPETFSLAAQWGLDSCALQIANHSRFCFFSLGKQAFPSNLRSVFLSPYQVLLPVPNRHAHTHTHTHTHTHPHTHTHTHTHALSLSLSLYVTLSLSLSLPLSLSLSLSPSLCLHVSISLSIYLSLSLSCCLSLSLFFCCSICISPSLSLSLSLCVSFFSSLFCFSLHRNFSTRGSTAH